MRGFWQGVRIVWFLLVTFVLLAVFLDAVTQLPEAKSAMQVSQIWDQVTAVALVLIAVTLAGWLVLWQPRRAE